MDDKAILHSYLREWAGHCAAIEAAARQASTAGDRP